MSLVQTLGFEDVLNIHNDLNGYYKLTARMIDCCSNKTNIFNIAGGITAYNYGTIYGCINNGNIIKLNYGSSCTGGITYHNKGMISNCQNNGNISAAYCVGGIAAINEVMEK